LLHESLFPNLEEIIFVYNNKNEEDLEKWAKLEIGLRDLNIQRLKDFLSNEVQYTDVNEDYNEKGAIRRKFKRNIENENERKHEKIEMKRKRNEDD